MFSNNSSWKFSRLTLETLFQSTKWRYFHGTTTSGNRFQKQKKTVVITRSTKLENTPTPPHKPSPYTICKSKQGKQWKKRKSRRPFLSQRFPMERESSKNLPERNRKEDLIQQANGNSIPVKCCLPFKSPGAPPVFVLLIKSPESYIKGLFIGLTKRIFNRL